MGHVEQVDGHAADAETPSIECFAHRFQGFTPTHAQVLLVEALPRYSATQLGESVHADFG